MTATAVEPDWNVYPCHPVGSWQRALTFQVAGVPVTPEDADALSMYDRHRSPSGRPISSRERERRRLLRIGRDSLKSGHVVALEVVTQRIARSAGSRDPAEIQGVLLALTPIGGVVGEDEARPYSPAGTGSLQRTYLHPDLFTVSGHYVARGWSALLKFRADHLREGRTDPMAPPTDTAPEPAPEPVVPAPEPVPEPTVDPATAAVEHSARRLLREVPGLSLEDLTLEVWVDLDAEVDEPDIVTALETLGYANEPTDERTAA